MGILFSKLGELFSAWGETTPSRILLLGLDGAGKTTILYKVKLNENIQTIPTIGFNVETVSPCPGVSFTMWDIGGQHKLRGLWRYYFQNTEGLIYVVDSSDLERINESGEELRSVLMEDEMRDVPVVVVANKQDLPNSVKCEQLVHMLKLNTIKSKWFVQSCSALSGDGIYEAMRKMSEMVKENQK